jgi:hypothetical protein
MYSVMFVIVYEFAFFISSVVVLCACVCVRERVREGGGTVSGSYKVCLEYHTLLRVFILN